MPDVANISVSPHGVTGTLGDEQVFIPILMVSGVVYKENRNHPDINKIHRDLLRVLGGKI